jgi:hypothetical protein
MTDQPVLLLVCLTIIAIMAIHIYVAGRGRASAETLGQIRDAVKNNLAETRRLHHTLRRQRGDINDIHDYLVPVSKGVRKPGQ